MPRRTRLNFALTPKRPLRILDFDSECRPLSYLMAIGIALNLVLLFRGDGSPGWPIASVILLWAAGAALVVERRES